MENEENQINRDNNHHVLATEVKGLRTQENQIQQNKNETKNYQMILTPCPHTLI